MVAREAELEDGRYTGKPEGVPSFGEGKVQRIKAWCAEHQTSFEGAVFYSDSHTDLPLLREVAQAIAVDPDDLLRVEAQKCGWEIISLRP